MLHVVYFKEAQALQKDCQTAEETILTWRRSVEAEIRT